MICKLISGLLIQFESVMYVLTTAWGGCAVFLGCELCATLNC